MQGRITNTAFAISILLCEPLEQRVLMSATATVARQFAPYVDTTLWPTYDLAAASAVTGNLHYTLAFITADPANKASWGGYAAYEVPASGFLADKISALRGMGGDVTISFGGQTGNELASVITNVNQLESAYQTVVDTYNVNGIDFDIEGAAVADTASNDRRSQAIAALETAEAAQGRTLQVWLTLPVLPTGLDSNAIAVVQSAVNHGVSLAGVNIMAMDYGDSNAPMPTQMGTYAIQAATSTFGQLQSIYPKSNLTAGQLWHMIGITPMIGVNDINDEIFTVAQANQLLTFAEQNNLGELAMWSATRDIQPASGKPGTNASPTDSGILQSQYAFTNVFKAYTTATDISSGNMDLTNTTVANITALVMQGYNSGNFQGVTGIASSAAASDPSHLTAVGAIQNTVDGTTTGSPLYGSGTALGLFEGNNAASTDVLVKYTYYGDTNLDGKVDGSDYSRIDSGYLHHATGWFNGDLNYDGVIDGSDYTLMDNTFNRQGAKLTAEIAKSTTAVIENKAIVPGTFAETLLVPGWFDGSDEKLQAKRLGLSGKRNSLLASTGTQMYNDR